METTTYKQALLEKFMAELVLLPDQYLYYFLGLVISFRKQIENLETNKSENVKQSENEILGFDLPEEISLDEIVQEINEYRNEKS